MLAHRLRIGLGLLKPNQHGSQEKLEICASDSVSKTLIVFPDAPNSMGHSLPFSEGAIDKVLGNLSAPVGYYFQASLARI